MLGRRVVCPISKANQRIIFWIVGVLNTMTLGSKQKSRQTLDQCGHTRIKRYLIKRRTNRPIGTWGEPEGPLLLVAHPVLFTLCRSLEGKNESKAKQLLNKLATIVCLKSRTTNTRWLKSPYEELTQGYSTDF